MWNIVFVSNRSEDMDAFNLVLFGLVVYAALVVVPTVWDDIIAHR